MVISYNQNVYFKIQCRKSRNKITLHFFIFLILQKIHKQILSCSSLGVGVWFIIQPIFPTFQLSSPLFSIALQTQLRLPHPLIASLPQCVCTHPIGHIGMHLLCCAHDNKHMRPMMQFMTFLLPLCEMLAFTWDKNNYMRFL